MKWITVPGVGLIKADNYERFLVKPAGGQTEEYCLIAQKLAPDQYPVQLFRGTLHQVEERLLLIAQALVGDNKHKEEPGNPDKEEQDTKPGKEADSDSDDDAPAELSVLESLEKFGNSCHDAGLIHALRQEIHKVGFPHSACFKTNIADTIQGDLDEALSNAFSALEARAQYAFMNIAPILKAWDEARA